MEIRMSVSLASIDPVAVAEEVCRVVAASAALAWRSVSGESLDHRRASLSSQVGVDALAIARYAYSGAPVAAFDGDLRALEQALVRLVSLLHIPPASQHQVEDLDAVTEALGGGTSRLAIPLDNQVNLALAGAWMRLRLERNEPITSTQLALAGGVSEDRVRAAIRSGQLPSTMKRPAVISASAARAWLSAREIKGFSMTTKVVEVGTAWVGLAYSPWYREWGRVTRTYGTREEAEDAVARAADPDPTDTPYTWGPDPDQLGWRVPYRLGALGDQVALR